MTCLYFVSQTYLINFEICMLICRLTGDKFNHWTWFREDTSLNTSSHISYSLFGSKTKPEVQESIRTHFGLVTRVANHINDGSVPWRCDSEPACTTPAQAAKWNSAIVNFITSTCAFCIDMTCQHVFQWKGEQETISAEKNDLTRIHFRCMLMQDWREEMACIVNSNAATGEHTSLLWHAGLSAPALRDDTHVGRTGERLKKSVCQQLSLSPRWAVRHEPSVPTVHCSAGESQAWIC